LLREARSFLRILVRVVKKKRRARRVTAIAAIIFRIKKSILSILTSTGGLVGEAAKVMDPRFPYIKSLGFFRCILTVTPTLSPPASAKDV